MTITASTTDARTMTAAQYQAMAVHGDDEKWPIPYAAMFMVSASGVLWYGIYLAGSALWSVIG